MHLDQRPCTSASRNQWHISDMVKSEIKQSNEAKDKARSKIPASFKNGLMKSEYTPVYLGEGGRIKFTDINSADVDDRLECQTCEKPFYMKQYVVSKQITRGLAHRSSLLKTSVQLGV